jgi:hypothetical protein
MQPICQFSPSLVISQRLIFNPTGLCDRVFGDDGNIGFNFKNLDSQKVCQPTVFAIRCGSGLFAYNCQTGRLMTRGTLNSAAILTAIFAVGLAITGTVRSQVPYGEFRKLLVKYARLTDAELATLDKGDVVSKLLEAEDKQEISAFGIVRMKALPKIGMQAFRDSISPKGSQTMANGGKLSEPPKIDDLSELVLEDGDFEELRKCRVGECDFNMSAEMIRRFQSEIDWGAADSRSKATTLMKQMLVAYAREYSTGGDSGLGRYDNRRRPVDLTASHRKLLTEALFIDELAPELLEFLRDFPSKTAADIDSSLHWSVVDFGLKPSIAVSHSAAYNETSGAEEQLFLATKQIYASRYLDASLTLTMLISVAAENGEDTYLIFSDRSRSDALTGPLGGFARSVTSNEAVERVTGLLEKAQLRLLTAARTIEEPIVPEREPGLTDRLVELAQRPIVWLGVLAAAGLILYLWRNDRKVS